MGRGGRIPAGIILAIAAQAKDARTQIAHVLEEALVRRAGSAQRIFGAADTDFAAPGEGLQSLTRGGNLKAESDEILGNLPAKRSGLDGNGRQGRLGGQSGD